MRSMVEGAPTPTRVHDSENYPFKVVENLAGRNAHGQEIHLLEVSVPCRISRRAVAPVVRFAVDLDCQARRETREVE